MDKMIQYLKARCNRIIDNISIEQFLLSYAFFYMYWHDKMVAGEIVPIVLFFFWFPGFLVTVIPIACWRKRKLPSYAKIIFICLCEITVLLTIYGIFFVGHSPIDTIYTYINLVSIFIIIFMFFFTSFKYRIKQSPDTMYVEWIYISLILLAISYFIK